jgi:hypothetical protein
MRLTDKTRTIGRVALLIFAAAFTLNATVTLINLATQVVGVLPTANGGTGQNSTATFPASGTVMTTSTSVVAGQMPALTGNVTTSAGGVATTIGAAQVTNAMLAAQAERVVLTAFCNGGSMASSSTVFMPGFGGVLTTCTGLGTTRTSGMKVQAGTIKNLNVNLGTGGKTNDKVTVEIAGVSSALTCTFGTGTSCSDTTHSAAVTAGQVLTIAVATGASETAANLNVSFELWN